MNITNGKLSREHREKMHPNELKIVEVFEKVSKSDFKRFDLALLKRVTIAATPEQAISIIYQVERRYPSKMREAGFIYIVPMIERMFKNKRGGDKK